MRVVKTGQLQGTQTVLTEGVKKGEKVVTNGQLTVTPGGKVRLPGPPAAGAGKPGEVKT
jgi:multidrug efflux system membrane fusion protein